MSVLAEPGPSPAQLRELDELERLEQLRDTLLGRLQAQRTAALEFYAWYQARQEPPALPGEYAPKFGRLREMSRTAWARLIVDATAERLALAGVRTTIGSAADEAAWAMLQANLVDADQRDVYVDAFIAGLAYVGIGRDEETGELRIAPESPLEVTHHAAGGNRRRVAAALKVTESDTPGTWLAELYTPTIVVVWTATYRDAGRTPFAGNARPAWSEEPLAVLENELGVVPFVPFENRPTGSTAATSELSELVPIMERVQELELAKMVAAHTAVFRQKWATGLEVPRDPETGKPVEPYTSAVSRLWINEDPDGRFGSFEATEIRQYLAAIDAEVAELAAISRVPSYYLVQSNLANPPSAESLVASETGLVTKCEDRRRSFGESWERVIRLAARLAGNTELAGDSGLEVIWATAERRNPAVVADAGVKLAAVGVPSEYVWEFLGFSPQTIARMRVASEADRLRADAALELPPAP